MQVHSPDNPIKTRQAIKSLFCLPFLLISAITFAQKRELKTILFVCEHGSAKSIVAASHFKKLAMQEGLDIKVIARGTNPDKTVPEK